MAAHTDTTPDGTAPAPTRPRRRRRAPFFVALAIILIAGGFTGVVLTSRAEVEQQARTRALEALAGRLDAELATAREQLAYIDGRLEERRVDAEQIEWLRARVARGPDSFESFADYEELYGMYERRRARWNRTLPQYRVVANAYRTLAGIHNAKLDSLNALGLPTPVTNGEDRADRYVRIAAVTVPLQ